MVRVSSRIAKLWDCSSEHTHPRASDILTKKKFKVDKVRAPPLLLSSSVVRPHRPTQGVWINNFFFRLASRSYGIALQSTLIRAQVIIRSKKKSWPQLQAPGSRRLLGQAFKSQFSSPGRTDPPHRVCGSTNFFVSHREATELLVRAHSSARK